MKLKKQKKKENNKSKNTRTCRGCGDKIIKSEESYIQIAKSGSEYKFLIDSKSENIDHKKLNDLISKYRCDAPDMQGKGKTMYITLNSDCIEKALKRKAINGAFKKEVPAKYYELLRDIKNALEESA